MESIHIPESAQDFIEYIESISHANLSRCWHCLCCSGGVPSLMTWIFFPMPLFE